MRLKQSDRNATDNTKRYLNVVVKRFALSRKICLKRLYSVSSPFSQSSKFLTTSTLTRIGKGTWWSILHLNAMTFHSIYHSGEWPPYWTCMACEWQPKNFDRDPIALIESTRCGPKRPNAVGWVSNRINSNMRVF